MAPIGLAVASTLTSAALPPSPTPLPLRLPSAHAFTPPPPGYRLQNDKLDGYQFFYPESWIAVTSSGNDIFFRNPVSGRCE